MNGDVIITGAGLIASLGADRQQVWLRVCAGQSGIGPLTALEQPETHYRGGGQAPELIGNNDTELPREARYLRVAIDAALTEAKIDGPLPYPSQRVAVVMGTTLHGMRAAGQFLRKKTHDPLRGFLAPAVLRHALGPRCVGFAVTTCSACSSGLGAVGLSKMLLESGEFDLVITGGYDPISEYAYAGFNSLRLIATGPLRPFCVNREGMKLGEGYAALVLERAEDAAKRRANPLAFVLGFGESADAHHLTQPHPEGDGAARAIHAALSDARVAPAEVDLISAHATGTPDNDRGECAALRRIFGAALRDKPVVGFKSHLGHTLGGAGAVELILSMMAITQGMVPPTAGATPAALEYDDVQLAAVARPAPLKVSMNTSIGFGGANACVVLGRTDRANAPAPTDAQQPKLREVFITGIGVVLPGAIGNDAFARRMLDVGSPRVTHDTGPIDDSELEALLAGRRVRRLSAYVKMSIAATAEAMRDAGVADPAAFTAECAAILGSAHGSAAYSTDYYREIVEKGLDAANPMLFAEGVPNAAAAHVSMAFGIKGGCQTIIGSRTSGLDALRLAALRIATGQRERMIVSAGEEQAALVNEAYGHFGMHHGKSDAGEPFERGSGFVTGCGAVTLILESADSLKQRGGRARGALSAFGAAACGSAATAASLVSHGRRMGPRFAVSDHVIASANGTAIDSIELALLRGRSAAVSTMTGHIAETFSVTPLAAIAAVLLTKHLPALRSRASLPRSLRAAAGDETPSSFMVLATDYNGTMAAAEVEPLR